MPDVETLSGRVRKLDQVVEEQRRINAVEINSTDAISLPPLPPVILDRMNVVGLTH